MKFVDVIRDERGFLHGTIGDIIDIGKHLFGGNGGQTREECIAQGMAFDSGTNTCTPITRASSNECRDAGMAFDTSSGQCVPLLGIDVPGAGNGGVPGLRCDPPLVPNDRGTFCIFPGGPSGGMGEFLKGQYGPAQEPFFHTLNVRRCKAGMVLGKDKLCYNIAALANKERLYPRGRKPLLTGGQVRAIGIAAAAGRALERKTKQLQGMGMMKKPARRAAPRVEHVRLAPVTHN